MPDRTPAQRLRPVKTGPHSPLYNRAHEALDALILQQPNELMAVRNLRLLTRSELAFLASAARQLAELAGGLADG